MWLNIQSKKKDHKICPQQTLLFSIEMTKEISTFIFHSSSGKRQAIAQADWGGQNPWTPRQNTGAARQNIGEARQDIGVARQNTRVARQNAGVWAEESGYDWEFLQPALTFPEAGKYQQPLIFLETSPWMWVTGTRKVPREQNFGHGP